MTTYYVTCYFTKSGVDAIKIKSMDGRIMIPIRNADDNYVVVGHEGRPIALVPLGCFVEAPNFRRQCSVVVNYVTDGSQRLPTSSEKRGYLFPQVVVTTDADASSSSSDDSDEEDQQEKKSDGDDQQEESSSDDSDEDDQQEEEESSSPDMILSAFGKTPDESTERTFFQHRTGLNLPQLLSLTEDLEITSNLAKAFWCYIYGSKALPKLTLFELVNLGTLALRMKCMDLASNCKIDLFNQLTVSASFSLAKMAFTPEYKGMFEVVLNFIHKHIHEFIAHRELFATLGMVLGETIVRKSIERYEPLALDSNWINTEEFSQEWRPSDCRWMPRWKSIRDRIQEGRYFYIE